MDVGTVRSLASPWGRELLTALPPYDAGAVFALSTRLRDQGVPAELVAALLTQQRLRARAVAKFGEFAADLLLTSDGLEQATRLEVATTHARRYAAASLATVHDLGCGIGADALTLSVLGVTVAAVDIDPVTAAVADANLRPWPDSRARVGRAEDFVAPVDALRDRVGVWLDPARRLPGVTDPQGRTRRTFSLDGMSPTWSTVVELATSVPATGVKLSPSFPHDHIPLGTEAQWTSWNGDVVECAIWWGPLARTLGRTARLLSHTGHPVDVDESMAEEHVPQARGTTDIGAWLYEPDRALLQAGLTGAVTAAVDGREVDAGLGYVIADRDVDLAFARRFAVHEVLPLHVPTLRTWLRERGVTGVTIKKRGVRLDDDHLRSQLKIGRGAGSGAQATVVLTRVAGGQVALVVDPA